MVDVNLDIKPGLRIRAFYLFFIIVGTQIGVGMLGVPRYIFAEAHQDAWISVLIAFVYMIIVASTMLIILKQYKNADIFGIQIDIFGKWIGKLLGTIYIIFFTVELLSVILTYIEVVQVFLYPSMPSFILGLLLMILIVYSVLGGVRVIVGVAFLCILLAPWIFVLLYDPISRIEMSHYLPMFQASVMELLMGARATVYTFLGLEILFIIYPFIDNKKKAKRPIFLGLFFSTLHVLLTTIIAIGYFSEKGLSKMEWPVLSLFKSVSLSFLERFDYLVVAEWMMVALPTMVFLMWATTYGVKRLYSISQRKTLYTVAILLLIMVTFLQKDYTIQKVTDIVSEVGFWIVFVYPIVLLPIVLMKKRLRKNKEGSAES